MGGKREVGRRGRWESSWRESLGATRVYRFIHYTSLSGRETTVLKQHGSGGGARDSRKRERDESEAYSYGGCRCSSGITAITCMSMLT